MAQRRERFLVDVQGRKTAVVMPLRRYRQMLEDLHDLAVVAERRDEATVPTEEALERLRRDGTLSGSGGRRRLSGICAAWIRIS